MHIKGNHKQNEKTVLRMQENICKWSSGQSINLQNIQTVHVVQYIFKKKNRRVSKKDTQMAKRHMKNAQHH